MQNLKENQRAVQEDQMDFLISNQEIEEIMSFFPSHFSADPNLREEQVSFYVLLDTRKLLLFKIGF